MAGIYITLRRMREVKFEEACLNRRVKQEFGRVKHVMNHTSCSCGSMGCRAIPGIDRDRVELTAAQAIKTLKIKKRRHKKITIKQYNQARYGDS